jgi:hypothetical protein
MAKPSTYFRSDFKSTPKTADEKLQTILLDVRFVVGALSLP